MTSSCPVAVCTIASKNYLDRARVLATSFRLHHPDIPVFMLLVDRVDGHFDPSAEPFTLVSLSDLPIADLPRLCFRYGCQELNTAVKPFFLQHLLDTHGVRKVLYFDPDIKFYDSVMPLFEALDTASFVFTPHLTEPLTDECKPSEREIMLSGTMNLGFIGVADTPTARRMLTWWQERLSRFCIFSASTGLFVDQKWMELVPSFFGENRVIRDPGYNVAYWNLQHRRIECREGRYLVNGEPLRFYHFSGFNADEKETISKHQNRYRLHDVPCLPELFEDYEASVMAAGYREVSGWPYAFATFDDGTAIPPLVREVYRGLDQDPVAVDFGDPFATGSGSFYAWLNEPVEGSGATEPVITRLAYEMYKRRADVAQAFPAIIGGDRSRFAEWVAAAGAAYYKVPAPFIDALKLSGRAAKLPAWSEEEAARAAGRRGRLVGRVARMGLGKLARAMLGPTLKNKIRDRLLWGRAGLLPPAPPAAGPRQRQAINQTAPFGANVVGYLRSESGVGESARSMIRSLKAADVPVCGTSTDLYCGHRKRAEVDVDVLESNPFPFNILCVNADATPMIATKLGADFSVGKYSIGYWFWELEAFPEEWRNAFDYLDEVWAASSFIQTCVSNVSPVPVVKVPLAIDARPAGAIPAELLALAPETFVFLFMYDYHSYPERKNPLAVLRAFQKAFSVGERVHLVLKGTDSAQNPAYHARLTGEARPGQVTLIDRYLDADVIGALMHRCDCYVSLHRSEGFGLTLAEAMYLGKPVIGTAYSANLDFMRPDNSYLVPYSLIEIDQDYGPYKKGWHWADADEDAAAELMRRVYDTRDESAARGAKGAQTIHQEFSPQAVGRIARRRLEVLRGPAAAGADES